MGLNYFDLTNKQNNIFNLSINQKDNFDCNIVDNNGLIYNGFKLAQSEKGNIFTVCDISFQKSATDKKYQARLIFRKTDENLKDKKLRADRNSIRISFDKGQDGYREFWEMIAFLYKWKETIDLGEFDDFFAITEKSLADILPKIADLDNKKVVLDNLKKLPNEKLKNIDNLVNIANINNILNIWNKNKEDSNEEFWQKEFQSNSWILSQIFSCPFILIRKKFYCGGKEDDDKGGVKGDLLYKNDLTGNLAFVEIKTPQSNIIGDKYRGDEDGKENIVYSMHKEITGGVNQLLNQRKVYLGTHGDNNGKLLDNPKCVLIIGKMPINNEEKKSFELYRNSLRDVEIITYDELFKRIESILNIFN